MKKDMNVSQEDSLKLILESNDLELLISYCHLTDPLRPIATKRVDDVLPNVLEEIDDVEWLWRLFDTPCTCMLYSSSITAILDRMNERYAQFSNIEVLMTLHQKFLVERGSGVYYRELKGRDLADIRKHVARCVREQRREKDFLLIMSLWLPSWYPEFKEFVPGAIAAEKNLRVLDEYWCAAWKRWGSYGEKGGVHDETAMMIWNRIKERRAEMKKNGESIPETIQQSEEAFLCS